MLLGFAGGFRRSELAALNCEDVLTTEDGLVVKLRRSIYRLQKLIYTFRCRKAKMCQNWKWFPHWRATSRTIAERPRLTSAGGLVLRESMAAG